MKGSRPVAKVNQTHSKFHVTGARSRRKFVVMFHKRQNQKNLVEFLKNLTKKCGRCVVILDNAPWHRGRKVVDFLTRNKMMIKLIYFPKYSPEINPTEQCWKVMKEPLANRYFRTLPALKQAVKKHLQTTFLLPKMFTYLCP